MAQSPVADPPNSNLKSSRTTPSSYVSKSIWETEDDADEEDEDDISPHTAFFSNDSKGKSNQQMADKRTRPSTSDITVTSHSHPMEEVHSTQMGTISNGSSYGPIVEFPIENLPDLTQYCATCNVFVSLMQLHNHKSFHKALQVMSLQLGSLPKNASLLLSRRSSLVKALKEKASQDESSIDLNRLNEVNWAYEVLKQYIEDTFDACHREELEVQLSPVDSQALSCSVDCVEAIGVCSTRNPYWKKHMEDAVVFQDCYGNQRDLAFIGLYDGHQGTYSCHLAASELHHLILKDIAEVDSSVRCVCSFNMVEDTISNGPESGILPSNNGEIHKDSENDIHQSYYLCDSSESSTGEKPPVLSKTQRSSAMKQSLSKAYKAADHMMSYGINEKSRIRWSGCSALTLVLENSMDPCDIEVEVQKRADQLRLQKTADSKPEERVHFGNICIANAGSVHAVLVRGNKAHRLSKCHDPTVPKERNRIENSGGFISTSGTDARVNGILSSTRGLGNHGDPVIKRCVPCEPSVSSASIDQFSQFIICASKGLWDVFSPQDAADIVLQMLPCNRVPTPSYISPSVAMLKSNVVDEAADTVQTAGADGTDHQHLHEVNNINIPEGPAMDTSEQRDVTAEASTAEGEGGIPNGNGVAVIEGEATPNLLSTDEVDSVGQDVDIALPHEGDAVDYYSDNGEGNKQEQELDSGTGRLTEPASGVEDSIAGPGDLAENYAQDNNELALEQTQLSDLPSDNPEASGLLHVEPEEMPETQDCDDMLPNDLDDFIPFVSDKQAAYKEFARAMSERLVQAALLGGSRDNVTVMVVMLPGSLLF